MATTIGSSTLPGTISTIESARGVGANVSAPGDVALVGAPDLTGSDGGSASANSVYRVTSASQARNLFGEADGSPLTTAVVDALVEGAYPVYAATAEQFTITGEDLSGKSGQSGTLINAPVIEQADKITFSINSTTKDTTLVYRDPTNLTPSTDEVMVNPITGKYNIDESQGNTGDDVDYEYFSYSDALDEVKTWKDTTRDVYVREVADFLVSVNENQTVIDDVKATVDQLESDGHLLVGQAGAGDPFISGNKSSYTNPYDTSRMQLYYPSRTPEGDPLMGSIAGFRAALGIGASPMFKIIESEPDLQEVLSQEEKKNLVAGQVTPLEERSGGAKLVEDLTTVSDSNTEESSWERSFARLVTDYVYEATDDIAVDYIGDLHKQSTRNSIQSDIAGFLQSLLAADQLVAFTLNVQKIDSLTASVDIGIKTTKPLRNIEVNITAGETSGGVGE